MTENFIIKAVLISLAAHAFVLGLSYYNRMNDPHYKALAQNRIEISYKPAVHRAVDIRERPVRPSQQLDLSSSQKYLSDGDIPVSLIKDHPVLPFGMVYERRPERLRVMELSHRVSITPIKSEKINNPVYAAYQEMVRDRIEQKVYQNYDKMARGTVYLTFLVDQRGMLVEARVIPEKTDASSHLQEISLRSLREASPFSPFLQGMNLTEYSFNIEIQYQVNDN